MEERDPWAAFGSKKFPFPNRKRSKNLVKWQQFCCYSVFHHELI